MIKNKEIYWTKYWEEHKDKVNAKRRLRYRDDDDYKKRVTQSALSSYYKHRKTKSWRWRKQVNVVHRVMPKMAVIDGEEMLLLARCDVADVIDIHPLTISYWLSKGVIEAYEDTNGHYWFPDKYVVLLKRCYEEHRQSAWKLDDFSATIKKEVAQCQLTPLMKSLRR